MVSATAALGNQGAIAYGNAIGSIICNTSLIAALTIAIRPAKIDRKPLVLPVIFFFVSAIFYSAVAYFTGYFSRTVGFILLGIFVLYTIISVMQAKKSLNVDPVTEESDDENNGSLVKDIIMLVIGAAVIAVGARLLVDNGTFIAEELHVPQTVIALTFVALGTSLPELVTTLTAIRKKEASLSVGNIIGANIIDTTLILPLCAVIN